MLTIAVVGLFVGVLVSLRANAIKVVDTYFQYRVLRRIKQVIDVREHEFFETVENYLTFGLRRRLLETPCSPNRKALITAHQETYWRAFARTVLSVVNHADFTKWTAIECRQYVMRLVPEFQDGIYQELLRRGIPEAAIKLVEDATVRHQEKLVDDFLVVFDSEVLDTNQERYCLYLDFVVTHIKNASADVLLRLIDANGELSKLNFNGEPVG